MIRCLATALALLAVAGCGGDSESTQDGSNATMLDIESQAAIHQPDQSGGNFYEVFVVVKNPSDQVAIDVSGQLSLKDGSGNLLESTNPTPINILAGGTRGH